MKNRKWFMYILITLFSISFVNAEILFEATDTWDFTGVNCGETGGLVSCSTTGTTWGGNGAESSYTLDYTNYDNITLKWQINTDDCQSSGHQSLFGFGNGDGIDLADSLYTWYCDSINALSIYENGGVGPSLNPSPSGLIDVKIILFNGGTAKYYYKDDISNTWTLHYTSLVSVSDTSMKVYYSHKIGDTAYDNVLLYTNDDLETPTTPIPTITIDDISLINNSYHNLDINLQLNLSVTDTNENVNSSYILNDNDLIIENGLVAYYNAENNFNDRLRLNNGTQSGGVTFSSSMNNYGNAFEFDGVDDYVSTAYDMGGLGEFSVSFWSNANINDTIMRPITGGLNFYIRQRSSGNIDIQTTGLTDTYMVSSTGINTNEDYYITFTYNGSVKSFYINGVLNVQESATGTLALSSPLWVGAYSGGNYFNGILDEVRIWDKALSQAEITTLYETSPYTQFDTNTLQPNLTLSGLSDDDYNIRFLSSNNETNVMSELYTFTIDTGIDTLNNNIPTIINNYNENTNNLYNYSDTNFNNTYLRIYSDSMNYTDYGYGDNINLTNYGHYNYSIYVSDLATNYIQENGTLRFDNLLNFLVQDLTYASNISSIKLIVNSTETNYSDISYSNPTQIWGSELGSILNYSYTDLNSQTLDKEGSINIDVYNSTYIIEVMNTPLQLNFYNYTGSPKGTDVIISDGNGNNYFNISAVQVLKVNKEFDEGYVMAIFNMGNDTPTQQYAYYNTLTNIINESILVLEDLNSFGYFKITDKFGVPLKDVQVKLRAYYVTEDYETGVLQTINQKYTDDSGHVNMFYEESNNLIYVIAISKDGYDSVQEIINLRDIENSDKTNAHAFTLTKSDNGLNNKLQFYYQPFENDTLTISINFFTTTYSTIQFKTDYTIAQGLGYETIPENPSYDDVFTSNLELNEHYLLDGNDINLYLLLGNGEERTYVIKQKAEASEIFGMLKNNNNEYIPLMIFIVLIMLVVGVRYQFKTDEMGVNIYFIGIIIMSMVTQQVLYGAMVLIFITIYYLTKGFKRMSENTQ